MEEKEPEREGGGTEKGEGKQNERDKITLCACISIPQWMPPLCISIKHQLKINKWVKIGKERRRGGRRRQRKQGPRGLKQSKPYACTIMSKWTQLLMYKYKAPIKEKTTKSWQFLAASPFTTWKDRNPLWPAYMIYRNSTPTALCSGHSLQNCFVLFILFILHVPCQSIYEQTLLHPPLCCQRQ